MKKLLRFLFLLCFISAFIPNLHASITLTIDSLKYEIFNDHATVVGYVDGLKRCIIPPSVHGTNVTKIDARAFSKEGSITEFIIDDSDVEIEFEYVRVKEINVIEFWRYRFYFSQPVKKIYIGRNIKKLRDFDGGNTYGKTYSPFNTKTLEEVIIGKEVTTLPYCLFSDCWNLSKATLSEGLKEINGFSRCGLKEISIPNSVTSIGSYAFRNCELKEIIIPDSVTSIGLSAFEGCSNLEKIIIPNSVTSIGYDAFAECSKLKEITIPRLASCVNIFGDSQTPLFGSSETIINFHPALCLDCLKYLSTDATIYVHKTEIEKAREFWSGEKLYAFEDADLKDMNVYLGAIEFKIKETPLNITKPISKITCAIENNSDEEKVMTLNNDTYNIGDLQADMSYKIKIFHTTGESIYYMSTNKPQINGQPIIKDVTQTTAIIDISGIHASSDISVTPMLSLNNNLERINETQYKLTSSIPGKIFKNISVIASYNGTEIRSNSVDVTLSPFNSVLDVTYLGPTAVSFTGSWTEGDAVVTKYGFASSPSDKELDGNMAKSITGLEPETLIEAYWASFSGDYFRAYKQVVTPGLTWSDGDYIATSKTSARIMVSTNCDAQSGTGIEWRRVDAPDIVKSTIAPCSVVDGQLVGTLRNLNSEIYYKYRPFYESSSGKKYYGDWVGLFTGDADVFFEPEVLTYAPTSSEQSVTLSGYALEGSDEIISQGFEYRPSTPVVRATSGWSVIKADGILMKATLTDLIPNATYVCRSFVTTSAGTYYGEEQQFTAPALTGIETIEDDTNEELNVALRENPVNGDAYIRISGSHNKAVCSVYSLSGTLVIQKEVAADGLWQSVEMDRCVKGMYLMHVICGNERKSLRVIKR